MRLPRFTYFDRLRVESVSGDILNNFPSDFTSAVQDTDHRDLTGSSVAPVFPIFFSQNTTYPSQFPRKKWMTYHYMSTRLVAWTSWRDRKQGYFLISVATLFDNRNTCTCRAWLDLSGYSRNSDNEQTVEENLALEGISLIFLQISYIVGALWSQSFQPLEFIVVVFIKELT